MAFFKFRFPGKAPEAATEGLAAAPGESMEVLRRRARHRLFGSVVLVFVAVVAFPLLFDSQPRPVAVDTPIVIPDRNSTPPLSSGVAAPVAQAPAKPLLGPASSSAPSSAVSAQASLEPGKEEVVVSSSGGGSVQAAAVSDNAHKPDPTSVAPVTPSKTETKPEVRDSTRSASDGQKAKALLEGKSTSADTGKFIVQVGAFADVDKVREVRRKLEQAGLKTYIQSVEGKDGKRTTRVRVGPFESRPEADKAVARIRKLDLPANLIAL